MLLAKVYTSSLDLKHTMYLNIISTRIDTIISILLLLSVLISVILINTDMIDCSLWKMMRSVTLLTSRSPCRCCRFPNLKVNRSTDVEGEGVSVIMIP